jgi:putative oxidoreductase
MLSLAEMRQIWTLRMLSVFRIVVALLYLQHPLAKFFAFPHIAAFDNLQPFSLIWLAGVIELVGGLLLLVGLFTRPAAFILSGEMAVAYFMAHAPRAFFPLVTDGEAEVFYCFAFLLLAFAGAGSWSIDHSRQHTTATSKSPF